MRLAVVLAVLASMLVAATAAQAATRCVGAAARDPWRSCTNPKHRLDVQPTPAQARTIANEPCTSVVQERLLYECGFGIDAETAEATVALIGDSHASHWRAALNAVAVKHAWHGRSIARTHCSFSRATKRLPEPDRSACVEWNRQVLGWMDAHPEVTTVFVSGISGGVGVVASGDQVEAQVAGYLAAWRALPRTVARIVVLRDTPKMQAGAGRCVERAIRARTDAGDRCAVARSQALTVDAAVVAASRWSSRRVRIVDLTPWLCDPALCFPVIGGVLVYRNQTHLTRAFSASLGPYLDRQLRRGRRSAAAGP